MGFRQSVVPVEAVDTNPRTCTIMQEDPRKSLGGNCISSHFIPAVLVFLLPLIFDVMAPFMTSLLAIPHFRVRPSVTLCASLSRGHFCSEWLSQCARCPASRGSALSAWASPSIGFTSFKPPLVPPVPYYGFGIRCIYRFSWESRSRFSWSVSRISWVDLGGGMGYPASKVDLSPGVKFLVAPVSSDR